MGFDLEKLRKATFTDRTGKVPVPDLAGEWFKKGDTPEFIVRGLSGMEMASVNDAVLRNRNLKEMLDGVSAFSSETAEYIKAKLFVDGKMPDKAAKEIEVMKIGSVSPDFEHIDAVNFYVNYPVESTDTINKIWSLTGKGRLPGEFKPSGKKTKSK